MGKKAKITVMLSGRKHFLFSHAGLFPSFVWLTSLLRLLFPLTHLSSKFHYNGLNCWVIAFKCSEGHTQRRHSIVLHVRQLLDIAVLSVVKKSWRVSFNTLPSVQTVWNYQAWRNISIEAILTWLILNVCQLSQRLMNEMLLFRFDLDSGHNAGPDAVYITVTR